MLGATPRLGDLIDDHCPRCKLLLNHAIASMMDGKVAKVICQTCLTEHPYLHEDSTKRKKPPGGRETLADMLQAHEEMSVEDEAEEEESPPKKKKAAPAKKTGRKRTAK